MTEEELKKELDVIKANINAQQEKNEVLKAELGCPNKSDTQTEAQRNSAQVTDALAAVKSNQNAISHAD